MELQINPEFQNLIPPLTEDEYQTLENSIIEEGCRDALVIWNDTIIDGHNRYEICQKNNMEFQTIAYDFDSEKDVKVWIIDNQKGRRNLTDGWKYELEQKKRELLIEIGKQLKAEAGKKHQGNQHVKMEELSTIDKSSKVTDITKKNKQKKSKSEPKHNTQKEIAKDLGWSTGKVAMADKIWKEADETLKEKIKAGEETIGGAYKKLTEHERKAKRREVIQNEQKEVDNFSRLKKHALALAEGLEFWADKTMVPESEDEAIDARIVLDTAPSIITHYSRLGINILKIYDTFIDPNRKEITNELPDIDSLQRVGVIST